MMQNLKSRMVVGRRRRSEVLLIHLLFSPFIAPSLIRLVFFNAAWTSKERLENCFIHIQLDNFCLQKSICQKDFFSNSGRRSRNKSYLEYEERKMLMLQKFYFPFGFGSFAEQLISFWPRSAVLRLFFHSGKSRSDMLHSANVCISFSIYSMWVPF